MQVNLTPLISRDALVNDASGCSHLTSLLVCPPPMPETHPLHKEGIVVNRQQGHGWPRLIDARGERRLARVVRSNRRATVAQIDQEVNAGSDGKVSEYTVHHSLLRMGLHSCRQVRVPMLTPVHLRKH